MKTPETLVQRVVLATAAVVWIGGLAVGFGAMWSYTATPGKPGAAPAMWPASSAIPRNKDGLTLVLLAHPKCPCTRATMSELASLAGSSHGRVKAYVAFFKPSDFPSGWERTDTWRAAERIPGVTPLADVDGIEAARFGSLTSGQALLYDRRGRLVFQGGITYARGHLGENAGRTAVLDLLTHGRADTNHTAVFGCPIRTSPTSGGTS